MSIVLLVEYTPVEGKKNELLEALTAGAAAVHAEAGCEKYAFHSTKEKVYLIESWADKDALEAHANGEPIKALRAATQGLLTEQAKITPLRPAPSGDPAKGIL